jgi:hypothetical protein
LAYSPSSKAFEFSPVVWVPHQENNEESRFRNIKTSIGTSITLTPEHLILAGNCNSEGKESFTLQQAQNVEINLCVVGVKGIEKVVSNTEKYDNGLYTIVTQSEFVVVDGLVASPFAVNHYIVNKFYNVHRLFYATFPASFFVHTKVLELATYIAGQIALFSVTFSLV